MDTKNTDDLVNDNQNNNISSYSSQFYPTPAFDGGFAEPIDSFDTHNPFADFKSTSDFTSLLTPSPIASSSTSAFSTLNQNDSQTFLGTINADLVEDIGSSSYEQTNHFATLDIPGLGQTQLNAEEPGDEGGFDGQKLTMPETSFSPFNPSDNGFADHDSTQYSATTFIPDDPAFQDQELIENYSPNPTIISPISPPPSRVFQETSAPSSAYHVSSEPPPSSESSKSRTSGRPPAPSAPLSQPAPFRPFGVTATLTSSVDEEVDEPLMNSSTLRSVNSARPPLPDILGGGSSAASMLMPDSRGALPAFKKSPKKTNKTTSSSESISASRPSSSTPTSLVKEQTETETVKRYRPLGLKIAEAKPIVAIIAPEDSAPSPSNTPSQLPAPKLAEPVLTTSSSPDRIPEITPPISKGTPPMETEHDRANEEPEGTIPQNVPTTDVRPDANITSSTPLPAASTHVTDTPNEISSTQDERQSDELNVDKSKPSSGTTPGLSIIVPAPPQSLPTVAVKPSDEVASIEPRQDDAQANVNHTASGAPPSNTAREDTASIAPAQPSKASDSDSEDERPLASVREGLVQQQSASSSTGRRDPATGLTPTTPAQNYFRSQDTLRHLSIQPSGPRYKCSVGDPQKMGMINDIHTVYTVKTMATDPSASGPLKNSSTVLRRFRDFVWLFDALTSNNPGVIVPPIPDKNLRSRFQEGFIATRRVALEIFLQKTANHPMLVSDPDLKLFLESDSFSLEIKHRKADSSNQSGWLSNIAGPRFSEIDDFFDHRKASLDTLEAQLKTLHSSLSAASKARRAYAQSLSELSQAILTLSTCDLSKPIRNALDRLAGLHRQCYVWSEDQSKQELEGITATVEAYSRLMNSVRLTFGSRIKSWEKWQASLSNLRKVQTNHDKAKRYAASENSTGLKHSLAELIEAERRAQEARNEFGDVSKLIKAEMQRFDTEKVEDFKSAICAYVDGMTERQKQIVHVWQEYYHLLQSLTKQNAEAAAPPAKPAQDPESANASKQVTETSTVETVALDSSTQITSISNDQPAAPANEETLDPSPWSNETSQPSPISPPPDPIDDLPASILAESSVFQDIISKDTNTHEYPNMPGLEADNVEQN
ncbi:Vps5 C terminal like-domain-containing protein [Melampsora americana]|nr:Vps5 C terminal like-domain-containing protein [Melampsora americana]